MKTDVRTVRGAYGTEPSANGRGEPSSVGDVLNQTLGSLNAETTADQLKEALQNLGQKVTGADDLTRQVTRTAAVTRLAELGIRGPAGLVDAATRSDRFRPSLGSAERPSVAWSIAESWTG
jgi:hypothetical protein